MTTLIEPGSKEEPRLTALGVGRVLEEGGSQGRMGGGTITNLRPRSWWLLPSTTLSDSSEASSRYLCDQC